MAPVRLQARQKWALEWAPTTGWALLEAWAEQDVCSTRLLAMWSTEPAGSSPPPDTANRQVLISQVLVEKAKTETGESLPEVFPHESVLLKGLEGPVEVVALG